ncbi:YdcF family protein [Maridesulfovibrio sp. FT414]|uniref:YdcF family protein n=1 Tax=Maridesulfovibrio sp. FT414 TaxID=2979469 RepID=UPI003D807D30
MSAILFLFATAILEQEDTLESADAIVVLGGQYFRPIYAAELFHKGLAPVLLVSKPITMPEEREIRRIGVAFPYQWEAIRDILLKKGVPSDKFRFFGHANMSTLEEAEELKKVLTPEIKKLIVVTSPLHTRRAGLIFRDVLPPEVRIIVTATPYDKGHGLWWKDFRIAPFVLLEVAKTVYFELGGGFRSSDQPAN